MQNEKKEKMSLIDKKIQVSGMLVDLDFLSKKGWTIFASQLAHHGGWLSWRWTGSPPHYNKPSFEGSM